MRYLILLLVSLNYISSFGQRTLKSDFYRLYSSDDRVYYKNHNKWQPVLYDETKLEDDSKIKTNAPFAVIKGRRILFCPASKDAHKLKELIKMGGKRNSNITKTHARALLITNEIRSLFKDSVDTLISKKHHDSVVIAKPKIKKRKYHYLVVDMNGSSKFKEDQEPSWAEKYLSFALKYIFRTDTNNLTGYNKILIEKNETTKDFIYNCLKTLTDSSDYCREVFICFSCPGITDNDGRYHFITSDTKYDSLKCNYVNTLPLDTLNKYISILESKYVDVYVFIDTNSPKDIIRNIYNKDKYIAYSLYKKDFDEKIVNESWLGLRFKGYLMHGDRPYCVRYYIMEQEDDMNENNRKKKQMN